MYIYNDDYNCYYYDNNQHIQYITFSHSVLTINTTHTFHSIWCNFSSSLSYRTVQYIIDLPTTYSTYMIYDAMR